MCASSMRKRARRVQALVEKDFKQAAATAARAIQLDPMLPAAHQLLATAYR